HLQTFLVGQIRSALPPKAELLRTVRDGALIEEFANEMLRNKSASGRPRIACRPWAARFGNTQRAIHADDPCPLFIGNGIAPAMSCTSAKGQKRAFRVEFNRARFRLYQRPAGFPISLFRLSRAGLL